ncbi:MAG TPA: MotA/TolQ/ExbB proton channel family protein [Spirochaetota bacterium]|nr:MotA/TolQ/ExbB proton channel family protein [Spirochaetota bacterium]HPJ37999.1 MotA/TolQ/ExbB proton channel family protein [Spirochaetota bacterium]HPQ53008.1 MotA/TolQ/ExbB proton channel family protein [Spirochaetota bacterium]
MTGETLISFFTSFPMWVTIVPIGICSIISLTVIVERFIYFKRIDYDYRLIIKNVLHSVKSGKAEEAVLFCENYIGPIITVIRDILKNINLVDEREGVILGSTRNAIVAIEKNVGILATIATISPMLGLFGTVTGLLKAFIALSHGGPEASSLLSYGVAEALITTILGLLVAIPSWIFYNYMVSRLDFYVREVEYISNSMSTI